jgi:CrcB protein
MNAGTVALVAGFIVAAMAGTAVRSWVTGRFNRDLPVGTLGVNMAASFVLGLIASVDDPVPVLVGIGAMGALSTWSTVANEVAVMARDDEVALGVGYLGLTVSTGVLAAWFGLTLGPLVFG